jgi:hypothetical protein
VGTRPGARKGGACAPARMRMRMRMQMRASCGGGGAEVVQGTRHVRKYGSCGAKHSIRQHTLAYVSIRQHSTAYVCGSTAAAAPSTAYVSIRQHTSAYVSIRQHSTAYVCGSTAAAAPTVAQRLLRQYVYFCTSKASKIDGDGWHGSKHE